MDLQNIEKINFSIAANVAVGLAGLVVPGFLLIFVYDSQLFIQLDFWKLFVLSVSACLPTFLVPYGLSALMHRVIAHDRPGVVKLWGTPVDWYIRHAYGNAINMYTLVLGIWFFDLEVSGIVGMIVGCSIFNALMEGAHLWRFNKSPDALFSVWLLFDSKPSDSENK